MTNYLETRQKMFNSIFFFRSPTLLLGWFFVPFSISYFFRYSNIYWNAYFHEKFLFNWWIICYWLHVAVRRMIKNTLAVCNWMILLRALKSKDCWNSRLKLEPSILEIPSTYSNISFRTQAIHIGGKMENSIRIYCTMKAKKF